MLQFDKATKAIREKSGSLVRGLAAQIGMDRGYRDPVDAPEDWIAGPFLATGTGDYDADAAEVVIDLREPESYASDPAFVEFLPSGGEPPDVTMHMEGISITLPKAVAALNDPDLWALFKPYLYLRDSNGTRTVNLRHAVGFGAEKVGLVDSDLSTTTHVYKAPGPTYLEFEEPIVYNMQDVKEAAIYLPAGALTNETTGLGADFAITAEIEGYAFKAKSYPSDKKGGVRKADCACRSDGSTDQADLRVSKFMPRPSVLDKRRGR